MSKKLPLLYIHRLFNLAVLLVMLGFVAFLAYLYFAFEGPLVGQIDTKVSPDLLTHLDEQRIETALGRLQARTSLPDIPADLPDPYRPPVTP